MEKYLSIFAVYVCNKVYSKHNCFILTTVCNLNCKFCLNYTPYIKKMQHADIHELKKNIDIYFSCIDRVGLFHLSGGEPFLYPDLIEIISYIKNNFNDQIELLGTSTNGSILPSDELCKLLHDLKIKVYLDNYTEAVPQIKETYQKILDKFKDYNIDFSENKEQSFFKTFPPGKECCKYNESDLIQKFDECFDYFGGQQLKNERLYSCFYSSFAFTAGLISETPDDFLNLSDFKEKIEINKKILTEFRLGYNNKGYVDFCKFCNGTPSVNPFSENSLMEQAKGRLTWDINNPTYLEDLED